MSTANPERTFARQFLKVGCPCGRELRAKVELVGSQIRCWDCQRMVLVAAPRSSAQAKASFVRAWREIMRSSSVGWLMLASLALTIVLAIPRVGIALALPVVAAAAWGYGELVRRSGIDASAERVRAKPGMIVFRALAVGLAILVIGAPFLLSPGGIGRPPQFVGLTLATVLLGALVVPVLLMTAFARGQSGFLSWHELASTVRWYPVSVLCALAVVPLGFVVAELVTFAMTYYFKIVSFLLLDLFPVPDVRQVVRLFHIMYYLDYGFGVDVDPRFLSLYAYRLSHGFTLIGAIPASLPVPKSMIQSPWCVDMSDHVYLIIRMVLTLVIGTIMLTSVALQARWLGLLATTTTRLQARAAA